LGGPVDADRHLVALPELEPVLELLGSAYNKDQMQDQLETFWTQMRRASESPSSRVPPSVARKPPDGLVAFVFLSFSCRLCDSN
jgi:hypothetical protein